MYYNQLKMLAIFSWGCLDRRSIKCWDGSFYSNHGSNIVIEL